MAINGIGRIWHLQVHIVIPCKEPWKVCPEASIGTSQLFMDVSFFAIDARFTFVQEHGPFCIPQGQSTLKAFLVRMYQQQGMRPQLFAGLHLGLFGQVPSNDCHLMEIAHQLNNNAVFIADKNSIELPDGIAGEIIVCGNNVGRGYNNNEQLTKTVFVDLFGNRCYRTGDLGRKQSDGTIEYLGRIDRQVK